MNHTETQPEAPAPAEVIAPARRKSLFREYAEAIFIAVLLALVIRQCGVQAFTIPSGSMMDTLLVGDYILVNKFLFGAELPFTDTHLPGLQRRRGDVANLQHLIGFAPTVDDNGLHFVIRSFQFSEGEPCHLY